MIVLKHLLKEDINTSPWIVGTGCIMKLRRAGIHKFVSVLEDYQFNDNNDVDFQRDFFGSMDAYNDTIQLFKYLQDVYKRGKNNTMSLKDEYVAKLFFVEGSDFDEPDQKIPIYWFRTFVLRKQKLFYITFC